MDDPTRLTWTTYDAVAERFLENARDRQALAPALDAFAAALPPTARVVDLGAGPMLDTALLAARGLRAVALDYSIGMLRAGRGEFAGPRLQADARRVPLAAGSADGVWANASLLHLQRDDVALALAAVRRILRPAGVFYVSVKAGHGASTEDTRYGLPRFFQYWTDEELDAVLTANGFEIVRRDAAQGPRERWLMRLARRS